MSGRILRLDHIGVTVQDPRIRLPVWADVLGLTLSGVDSVPTEGVRVWFLELGGGSRIELLESTDPAGTIAKSIEKRGEGLHHICLRVEGLEAIVSRLIERGLAPLGGGVRPGAHGSRVVFLHPKDTGGVLLELAEYTHAETTSPVGFGVGEWAIGYLQAPRERLFGRLLAIEASGVTMHALDLESWDGWMAQWSHGESGPVRPSRQFIPMSRVEKLLADEDSSEIPSLARQFQQRTERTIGEAFGATGAAER